MRVRRYPDCCRSRGAPFHPEPYRPEPWRDPPAPTGLKPAASFPHLAFASQLCHPRHRRIMAQGGNRGGSFSLVIDSCPGRFWTARVIRVSATPTVVRRNDRSPRRIRCTKRVGGKPPIVQEAGPAPFPSARPVSGLSPNLTLIPVSRAIDSSGPSLKRTSRNPVRRSGAGSPIEAARRNSESRRRRRTTPAPHHCRSSGWRHPRTSQSWNQGPAHQPYRGARIGCRW